MPREGESAIPSYEETMLPRPCSEVINGQVNRSMKSPKAGVEPEAAYAWAPD